MTIQRGSCEGRDLTSFLLSLFSRHRNPFKKHHLFLRLWLKRLSASSVASLNVGDVNFELKSSLINMVQASPFCGKPNEDANAHLQNFLELCDTVVIRGVAADAIKLRLFPFSL